MANHKEHKELCSSPLNSKWRKRNHYLIHPSCPISHLHSAALRTYFKDAMGLGPKADGTAKANAIIEEGIDDIANLHELYDEDSDTVTMSCNNVRKPSGTIA